MEGRGGFFELISTLKRLGGEASSFSLRQLLYTALFDPLERKWRMENENGREREN